MNRPAAATLLPALALALAGSGCAARRAAPDAAPAAEARCEAAFARADGLLRGGLEQVMADMTRYVKARDEGADTAAAAARARARAETFAEARAPAFVSECRGWPEERLRCVEAAREPKELSACGEGPLVQAFTDEVLAEFSADPLSRTPAPAAP